MNLRQEIEEKISWDRKKYSMSLPDDVKFLKEDTQRTTDQICSLIKSRLVYLVNSDYTDREQYDEMVNGLIKELEGNHPQDVPFNIDEVKEFFNKGGNDVKKAREE